MLGPSIDNDYERAAPATSAKLLGLSVVLWVAGVLAIRMTAPFGVFALRWRILLFVATVPMAWLTVDLAARVAGARTGLLQAAAIVCIPALLLDGLALSWAQPLYGAAAAPLQAPAAWLLWFVGVSLALAMWRASRQTAHGL